MNKHTILVVDDQKINRKILYKLLENEYKIFEAANGKEAMEILYKHKKIISAVLLDIIMPVMDGYEVLKAMSSDSELSKIPVIVSSQKDHDEDEIRALSLGAQDFISKPYKGDIICHRLKNTIRLRETAAIANKAEKDELTGLLSKQFFMEQVSNVLHQNPEVQYDIVCFDIERFKLVNDTYGKKMGDGLLRHIASLLELSPIAVLSSRFDADHFYQLIPDDCNDVSNIFKEFLDKVGEYPIEMKLNVNCGVFSITDIDAEIDGMCDRAKLAADLNRGKMDKPFSYYDDSIRRRMLEEQFIISSMKEGIEKHQFKVYYQPKYDLHTEMISGAEALVRWIHPEKGYLSPGEFIPIFEKNGFITQLDRYVWEEACKNIREWLDSGLPPVPISVNVSRADIFNPNLPEILSDLIKKYDIPIAYLHLEITESAYTDNPQQIIEVVGHLHDLGFVIEMDDFGSGYSSLNMLAELPVDMLKLDMGFVQTESTNSSGRGIMSFVISLAKWMKLSVIAEGVETAEQIEALRSMDCNFVQGYYFAKPMPKEDFEKTLRTVAIAVVSDEKNIKIENKNKTVDNDLNRVMLVVDDIEINRDVLNTIFCHKYCVVEKDNGRAALEYLRANYEKVDVVMLDLLMPVMDGFQFLEEFNGDRNMHNIPVVVTSQGDVSAEEKALMMGAEDFISKPYNPRIVRHRVENVVKVHETQAIALHELSETRKREQTLMDSIPGGVAIYHLKKNGAVSTDYVSDGLAKLCGYDTEEFLSYIKEDARVNVVREDIPSLVKAAKISLKENVPIHELQHIYTKNRDIVTVRLDANVMPTEDEESDDLAVIYAVHTKVSEDTESVIQEQNRYRYILDNLDVAYFEIESNGKLYASDKYSLYAMSEASPNDILKNGGNYNGVYADDLPILFEFFNQKNANLPKVSATLRLKMKDESYRWTEMMGFFEFDNIGNRIKSIGVLRDVDTEWQNQNRKLQEALNEAEKANNAKTNFLARVSHEMRTPLNGILGITELIEEKVSDSEVKQDIEKLKQSGEYLLDLIDDTLDVSSIEEGRMVLHPSVCDGKTVFLNVISMIKPSMAEKNIKFNLTADNLPFTKLYIDVGRVEQAIINILSNAVKFTPSSGEIDFVMENVSIEDDIITDKITIRDTGIGMSKEFVDKIFEPFTQEHTDSNSSYSGTGLGMTIAKQCIELMGGEISVSSVLGEGTEVSIILPMHVASYNQLKEWSDIKQSSDLATLKGKRVLICEDHPLNAQIAIRLLEKKGMLVEHAENGKVGVEMFAASGMNYYDAVLMDIRMPIMDGFEATRRIRSLRRKDARYIPIIAMTANAMSQDVKEAYNAGMTEHLGKPVEPKVLYTTLVRLIAQPNAYAGQKILVVDDIEMNRGMVKKAIQDVYTVLEAENGEKALEMLHKYPDIAAIVTDIQMPLMDGKELIKKVRAEKKFDNVAILANTIYGDHRQEDELLSLGANDFVYKPTSAQVVMMRLEHVLRNIDKK